MLPCMIYAQHSLSGMNIEQWTLLAKVHGSSFNLPGYDQNGIFPIVFTTLTSVTMRCTTPMCVIKSDLTSPGQSIGNSATSPWETATSASSGQGKNQSIVGPEINPGNFLRVVRCRACSAQPIARGGRLFL